MSSRQVAAGLDVQDVGVLPIMMGWNCLNDIVCESKK